MTGHPDMQNGIKSNLLLLASWSFTLYSVSPMLYVSMAVAVTLSFSRAAMSWREIEMWQWYMGLVMGVQRYMEYASPGTYLAAGCGAVGSHGQTSRGHGKISEFYRSRRQRRQIGSKTLAGRERRVSGH